MSVWALLPCGLPALALIKAIDVGRRLLGNRRRFDEIFPAGMQRAVSVWMAVTAIAFLIGPGLLLVGLWVEIRRLVPFGVALCLYAPFWTWAGHYVLLSQREYVRWWRLRRDVNRYLSLPVDRRPSAPPAGAVVI